VDRPRQPVAGIEHRRGGGRQCPASGHARFEPKQLVGPFEVAPVEEANRRRCPTECPGDTEGVPGFRTGAPDWGVRLAQRRRGDGELVVSVEVAADVLRADRFTDRCRAVEEVPEFGVVELGGRIHRDRRRGLGTHRGHVRQRRADSPPAGRVAGRPRRKVRPLVEHIGRDDLPVEDCTVVAGGRDPVADEPQGGLFVHTRF